MKRNRLHAKNVAQGSTVKAKKRTMKQRLRIQLSVWAVQRGGRRKKVARNAKRVVRVRMAMGVKIVPKVNSVKAVTRLLLRAAIVFQGITVMTWVKDLVCRVFRK